MLGIVTVQWNSSKLTCRLLDNLHEQLSESTPLVIVDNGSDEGHLNKLKQKLGELFSENNQAENPSVTLIENQNNSGFSRANNTGIDYLNKTSKTWIWLLNNDCQIGHGVINQLSKQLENSSAGLLGTKIIDQNDQLETYGGYVLDKWTSRYKAVTQTNSSALHNDLFYPSGASLLIHRNVIEQCGLLDETTFLYFEEIDLCLRAKQAGFSVGILPEVVINHLGAGSSMDSNLKNLKTYHETWSTLYFYSKHQKLLFPFVLIFRTIVKIIMLLVKSRNSEIKSVINATIDFVLNKNKDLAPVKITNVNHYQ